MIEKNNTNPDLYSYQVRLKGKKGLQFATSENKIVTFHFKSKQRITYKICTKFVSSCNMRVIK